MPGFDSNIARCLLAVWPLACNSSKRPSVNAVDLPNQMISRHRLVEIERVEELTLSALSPPHHRPLPANRIPDSRNHGSTAVSTITRRKQRKRSKRCDKRQTDALVHGEPSAGQGHEGGRCLPACCAGFDGSWGYRFRTEEEMTKPRTHKSSAFGWRESAMPVRRDKAALSSGCKSHPANAPAGSNRSSHGGNEVAEAFG